MLDSNIKVLKAYFEKYLNTNDIKVLNECINKYPNESAIINRLKNVIDNLNTYKKTFIDNVFDINNDRINMELVANLESQISNRTTIIAPVCEKQVVITSYYDFNREETIENCKVTKDEIMLNDGNLKKITEDNENHLFCNHIIEQLFNFSIDNSYIIKIDNKRRIIM